MQSIFSEAGMQRLGEIAGPGLLCAFDFDGTLAPIVPRPEQAYPTDEVRDRLVRLAEYAPVAIITGRSTQDARARLGFMPDFLVGNHGMEGVPGWEHRAASHEADCAQWKAQLLRMLRERSDTSGVELEDKRYSLSVHYRAAREPERAAFMLADLLLRLAPRPRLVGGKYVYNLIPQDTCHKGKALERLMQLSGARNAIYVGDDVTDEDVFRIARPDLLSVRVEHAEASAAGFFLPHFDDIVRLLEQLHRRLEASGARNWMILMNKEA